jgi:hypothetical protein
MLQEEVMEEERRQNQRARANLPVAIQTEEGAIERATYNISSGGAFIRGLSPLELHEVVDMTISGPNDPITVKARVVWSSNQIPPFKDMPRGVGVEFINISDEHREIISSLASEEIESSGSHEDEEKHSLIRTQNLIDEQSLIDEKQVKEEKEDTKKVTLGRPKKCPDGHRHISWSIGDERIFCWDCNRWYPLLACFRPPERELSDSERHSDQS